MPGAPTAAPPLPEVQGLLKAVLAFGASAASPIAQLIEAREHGELRGIEISAPFRGYVVTHSSRRDAAVLDIFARESPSGALVPVVYGLFPFSPCAIRVLAGSAEVGVTDARLANAVTLPPFVARALLTSGTTFEVVNPHARTMLKPLTDLVVEIVAPGTDFPSLVGRRLSIRNYARLIKSLRSR